MVTISFSAEVKCLHMLFYTQQMREQDFIIFLLEKSLPELKCYFKNQVNILFLSIDLHWNISHALTVKSNDL